MPSYRYRMHVGVSRSDYGQLEFSAASDKVAIAIGIAQAAEVECYDTHGGEFDRRIVGIDRLDEHGDAEEDGCIIEDHYLEEQPVMLWNKDDIKLWEEIVARRQGPRQKPVCRACGSEQVRLDVWADWSATDQRWDPDADNSDDGWCADCDGVTRIMMRPIDWTQEAEPAENALRFRNTYECDCGMTWEDEWSCACDDRCPHCDTSCSPSSSKEFRVEPDTGAPSSTLAGGGGAAAGHRRP